MENEVIYVFSNNIVYVYTFIVKIKCNLIISYVALKSLF